MPVTAKDLLKEKQKELTNSSSVEFPFDKMQIDQEQGKFRVGGRRNDEGEIEGAKYFDTVEFVFVKKYGEYFYFDPDKEQITKRTTIEENPNDCKELYSRVPVQELKDAGYEMKFLAHYVGLLKEEDHFIPIDFTAKGATLKAMIDFMSANRDVAKNSLLYKLKMTLERKKKGAVKYFVPKIEAIEITDEEAKEILEKVDEVVEKFEEFRAAYNSRNKSREEDEHSDFVEHEEEIPY